MEISFLIVTRNRPDDLRLTLSKLKTIINPAKHEVLVFIDGCSKTEQLINTYNWVRWSSTNTSISASPARNRLFKKATGNILIGLDDDAHPIGDHFIEQVESRFRESVILGIIAFQEIRGLFASDQEALQNAKEGDSYLTNDFVGCGFAIKREVYDQTQGFPVWIDIYGEESALAIEVMAAGYEILYCNDLMVNHRVNVEKRKKLGRNYFRFEHQLKNTLRYYIVYYPKPTVKILKTLWHNFKKYAITDRRYFLSFIRVCFSGIITLESVLRYRKPISEEVIKKRNKLRAIRY